MLIINRHLLCYDCLWNLNYLFYNLKKNITGQDSSEGNTTATNYFTIFLQTTNVTNFY